MQKILLYILPILLIFTSCNEPLPTQLVEPNISDNTKVEIETLSPEPDLFAYENGYDTLGFVASLPPNKAIISISGIKNSYKRITIKRTTAFAVYINKEKRIERKDGRLLGFASEYVGKTSFNNIKAVVIPRKIKYKWHGNVLDTTLGLAHVISIKRKRNSLYPFPYNSNVKFHLEHADGDIEFDIPTPSETTGKVKIEGTTKDKNLKINLFWNGSNEGQIVIVVGGMNPSNRTPFPLYRIRVKDNGRLTIPKSLMKTFPFNRFKQIMFSFVKQKFVGNPSSSKNIVVAQSIHNIKFDVP